VVSLTGLSSDGAKQTFTSLGKPGQGQTWPNEKSLKYNVSWQLVKFINRIKGNEYE